MTSFSADAIRRAAQRAVRQATLRDRVQWVAFRVEVSWRRVRALCEQPAKERFFWERPAEKRTIAAFGVAHAIECDGSDRFAKSAARARDVFARIHVADATASDYVAGAIAPGFVRTEAGMRTLPEGMDQIVQRMVPLKGFGDTDDVVGALLYLASSASDWVTGQTLNVDGGWIMRI